MSKDLVPAGELQPLEQNFPIAEIGENPALADVRKADAAHMHYLFCRLEQLWKEAKTKAEVVGLMNLTVKLMKDRRDLYLMPNAYQGSAKKEGYVYPLD